MQRRRGGAAAALAVALLLDPGPGEADLARTRDGQGGAIALPEPRRDGGFPVERALARRRSIREYADAPLSLAEVSQLLWAAQGITGPDGERTAPSAGALYPLEIHVVAGAISNLPPGLYHYDPRRHRLQPELRGDLRGPLADAALEQDWVAEAPVVLVLSAVYARTARKYGGRAPRYVHMELGHAAQNVYLQAVALELGTTLVGAFHDRRLQKLLAFPSELEPLGVMPVGRLR